MLRGNPELSADMVFRQFAGESRFLVRQDIVIANSGSDKDLFHNDLKIAIELAEKGCIVTFGVPPSRPATQYGYIRKGTPLGDYPHERVYNVEKFVENASKLSSLPHSNNATKKDWSVDKIEKFTSVFDQVTSVLSRIDARHFFPNIIGESLAMRGSDRGERAVRKNRRSLYSAFS